MISADWVNEKCLECHTEKRGPFLWEHAPVRENCLNCHDPHGSNHDKMLVAKQPYLCQRCHLNTRHPGTLYDGQNTVGGGLLSNRAVEHACRTATRTSTAATPPRAVPGEVAMKRAVFVLALAVGRRARAGAEDAVPTNYQFGEIDFGAVRRDDDTNSSKFLEYRDIPNGFVLPFFRLDGAEGRLPLRPLWRGRAREGPAIPLGLEKGWFRLDGGYQFIPHDFGNGAQSLENHTGGGRLRGQRHPAAAHQARSSGRRTTRPTPS